MTRSFWSLVWTQYQVLFNDNAAKLTLMAVAIAVLSKEQSASIKSILAGLMILPFVLLSPAVGWLSDRFSKRDVIRWALWMQVAVMFILLMALWAHIFAIALVGIFLLGLQLAIFAPAKQGIIKEIVSGNRLTTAVGMMESSAIVGILLGTLAGGWFFDYCYRWLGDAWDASKVAVGVLGLWAVLCLLASSFIKQTPAHSEQPFRRELFWEHFVQLKEIWRQRNIRLCVLGYSYFYALAGAVYLSLLEEAHLQTLEAGGVGTATLTGFYMAMMGVGIIAGSMLVSWLTYHHIELGLIPFGSFGMILATLLMGIAPASGNLFVVALILLGLGGAIFVIPLNAWLQEQVKPTERGRVMSVSNLVLNLIGIVAVVIQYFLSATFHFTPAGQFLLYALPTSAVTVCVIALLPETLLRFAVSLAARLVYRVRGWNVDRLPATGGVLLLPNHLSYVDAILLQLACPRPIRFLIFDQIYSAKLLNWGLRLLRSIPISPKRAKTAIDAAAEALAQGDVVCIFPEGGLSRTAMLQKLNRGYEIIARRANAPVMPVWLENIWGSVFSYYGGRFFFKPPRQFPYHVDIYFGPLIPVEACASDRVRQELYDLSEHAFSRRPELDTHLGYQALQSLKGNFFSTVLTDAYLNNMEMSGGKIMAAALELARILRLKYPDRRLGIILPPGVGATLVNLACVLAGKTPVNLNVTAGRNANESALRRAELKTLISSPTVMEKFKEFPWANAAFVNVSELLGGLDKKRVMAWYAAALILPATWLRRLGRIRSKSAPDAEGALLFTSGSSGEPKCVVLTHRNILANTAQIAAVMAHEHIASVLGSLPIFHSFGCTVTFWWPLLGGPRVVTFISPTDTVKLAEIVEEQKISLMLTTPTFLRAYMRRTEPKQMASLRLIVTGAEKLPMEFAQEFEDKFKVMICEGYGMTEATPVVSVNLPDFAPTAANPEGVKCREKGSTGRLLPGISVRICDIDTGLDKSIFESGIVHLKGANIFPGYLHDLTRTAEVLQNGWYRTGDIGRVDDEGFLHIEGRVSRFSKIAGEMVPHGTVEAKISQALELPSDGDTPPVVIVGLPDESKGEILVALSAHPIDLTALRKKLLELGLPSLWIPKAVRQVEHIPVLATGKVDLPACLRIAKEGVALPASTTIPAPASSPLTPIT